MTGAQTLAIAVICTCIGAASAGYVQELRFTAKISSINEANAKAVKKVTDEALIEQNGWIATAADIDAKHTKELNEKQATIDRLSADVDSGKRRLRINATCPAAKGQAATAASVGDGDAPRLTDAAKSNYFTLRKRIEHVNSMIATLQAHERDVCLK